MTIASNAAHAVHAEPAATRRKSVPGNYNRVILVGNLTKDPETKTLGSGQTVCKFGIAVNRRTKTTDETMFVEIVAWEKLADLCRQYLKKGRSVLVEGRLAIRSYEDQNGAKRKATEVVIDAMQMLDAKDAAPAQASLYGELDDSEIPF
jgi:single-strand DNA-binding protein